METQGQEERGKWPVCVERQGLDHLNQLGQCSRDNLYGKGEEAPVIING